MDRGHRPEAHLHLSVGTHDGRTHHIVHHTARTVTEGTAPHLARPMQSRTEAASYSFLRLAVSTSRSDRAPLRGSLNAFRPEAL